MKIRNTSSGITPIVVLLLLTVVGSATVSGQPQQQAAMSPNPQTAAVMPEARAVSPAIDTPSTATESAPATTRPPARNRTARMGIHRPAKQVVKEAGTDPITREPNPATSTVNQPAVQAAGESAGSSVSTGATGALVPNEIYPPDPTPAAATPATVADSSPPKPVPQPQIEHSEPVAVSTDYSMVKAAGGFGLVLCLIALAYVGGRKLFPKYFVRGAAEKSLKLVETLAIGEKRSIAVIEFEGQRMIIGNTPNQVTLLATLPMKLSLVEDSPATPAPSFEFSKSKIASDSFRGLYEIEKTNGRGNRKAIPPDIQAKMRQLRESLEQ